MYGTLDVEEPFDKTTSKLFIQAILERNSMKKCRNLRCFRLTTVVKNALIKGEWLSKEGHYYTIKNTHIVN